MIQKRFIEAVSVYTIAKIIMLAGSIFALSGAGISLAHIPYFSVVYSNYHDDSTWYSAISTFGYMKEDTPFFPLFPLLCSGIHELFGISVVAGGIIISNCLMIADIYLIFALFRRVLGERTGRIGALIWALFPMAVFLSSDYTESLFMFGMIGSLLCLHRRQFWGAALFAVIASATRNTGVLLFIPVAFSLWGEYRSLGRIPWRLMFPFLLVPFALCSYFGYLWAEFGSPMVWSGMEKLWGRELMFPLMTVYHGMVDLPHLWSESKGYAHIYYLLQYGAVALALLALPTIWRSLPRSWFFLCLAQILIPLSDPGIGIQTITGDLKHISDYFFSFDRFALTMIPVFAALAIRLRELKFKPSFLYGGYAAGTVLCSGAALTLHMFIG